nr:hypothetical protein [Enterococcus casseliflavus]
MARLLNKVERTIIGYLLFQSMDQIPQFSIYTLSYNNL